jgi:hypothetical protein
MTSETREGSTRKPFPVGTNVEADFSKTFCFSNEESCLEVKSSSRSVFAVEGINLVYTDDEVDEFAVGQVFCT